MSTPPDLEVGWCPIPQLHQKEVKPVLYRADGTPLTNKSPIGFKTGR